MNVEMNRKIPFRLFAALLLGTLVLYSGNPAAMASGVQDRIVLAALGGSEKQPAPEFELSDLNGSKVRLSKFKGDRPVLLYFWATWCPYCISAKPKIAKLRENIAADQLEILGINVGEGDSVEKVKRFQQGHPSSWPILYDEGSKVSKNYQVQGIPLFILVDKTGNIAYRGNNLPADPMKHLK